MICIFFYSLFLQCTGLVQFKDEAGRSAALKLNKTQMGSETIGVTPSRFSLIPVANAPAETTASAAPTSSSSSSSHSAPSSSSSKSDHSVPTNVTEDTSSTLGTSTGVGVKSTSDGGKVKQTTAAALAK